MDLKNVLHESFATYAGMTIVDRAITDARDCLKPSARQAMYAQYLEKIVHDKPYRKSAKSVAAGMDHFYTHGDTSLYSLLMRMGKPFAYRYPLEDVQGTYGTLVESDNQAAQRYTEMRLSALAAYLFEDIEKDSIKTWFNNYDDTEQYPAVLPSKGFYNIVNGTSGIATAIASSIPQFNLREVNEALIKLLWNQEIDFSEIYCAPDFATGAILLNENEVKVSLENGQGKACKLRSVIDYDSDEHCLIVTEIPYGVYTMTIRHQLAQLIENQPDIGIEKFLDLSSDTPLLKIYLQKKANPEVVVHKLYKETSLQNHYSINIMMLENGRFPKIFGWRQALLAHLAHEHDVYVRSFNYDLIKLRAKLHIIEGILIALANIEEVISIIKQSKTGQLAKINLINRFNFSEIQAKAILDIKLVKLANLESIEYENEKKDLVATIGHIEAILNDEVLLKKEIEKGLREVIDKFGDARRTTILNLAEDQEETPIEQKTIYVNLTNQNNLYVYEKSTLLTQRKGGVGQKIKLNKNEYFISQFIDHNSETMLLFSDAGKLYSVDLRALPLDQTIAISDILQLNNERIIAITSANIKNKDLYLVFITKQGMVKKSALSEFNIKRSSGVMAIKLKDGDELVSILLVNDEPICMLSKLGRFIMIEQKDINAIGRVAIGVQGMKLEDNDEVVMAHVVEAETTEIVTVTNDGYTKRTDINEFNITGRNTKGSHVHKLDNNYLTDFVLISKETELTLITQNTLIKFPLTDINLTGKNTLGSRSIKLKDENSKIGILKS